MIEVGRLCVKTAGRDAMEYCVVAEVVDDRMVTVDGNTRRKNVNKAHLEPLPLKLDIKQGSDRATIQQEFEKHEIPVRTRGESRTPKSKEQQKAEKTEKSQKKTTKSSSKKKSQ